MPSSTYLRVSSNNKKIHFTLSPNSYNIKPKPAGPQAPSAEPLDNCKRLIILVADLLHFKLFGII